MIGLPDWQCICADGNFALHFFVQALFLEVIWECLILEAIWPGEVLIPIFESLFSQVSHSMEEGVRLKHNAILDKKNLKYPYMFSSCLTYLSEEQCSRIVNGRCVVCENLQNTADWVIMCQC